MDTAQPHDAQGEEPLGLIRIIKGHQDNVLYLNSGDLARRGTENRTNTGEHSPSPAKLWDIVDELHLEEGNHSMWPLYRVPPEP